MFLVYIPIIYKVLGDLINKYWIVNFVTSSVVCIVLTEVYNQILAGGLKKMKNKLLTSASFWGCEELV